MSVLIYKIACWSLLTVSPGCKEANTKEGERRISRGQGKLEGGVGQKGGLGSTGGGISTSKKPEAGKGGGGGAWGWRRGNVGIRR